MGEYQELNCCMVALATKVDSDKTSEPQHPSCNLQPVCRLEQSSELSWVFQTGTSGKELGDFPGYEDLGVLSIQSLRYSKRNNPHLPALASARRAGHLTLEYWGPTEFCVSWLNPFQVCRQRVPACLKAEFLLEVGQMPSWAYCVTKTRGNPHSFGCPLPHPPHPLLPFSSSEFHSPLSPHSGNSSSLLQLSALLAITKRKKKKAL